MAAVYDYVCKKCGVAVEADRLLAPNTRHLIDSGICGVLRRDYSSVNVNVANLKGTR